MYCKGCEGGQGGQKSQLQRVREEGPAYRESDNTSVRLGSAPRNQERRKAKGRDPHLPGKGRDHTALGETFCTRPLLGKSVGHGNVVGATSSRHLVCQSLEQSPSPYGLCLGRWCADAKEPSQPASRRPPPRHFAIGWLRAHFNGSVAGRRWENGE